MMHAMTRRQKRNLLLAFDTLLVPCALYLAFALRFSSMYPRTHLDAAAPLFALMFAAAPVVGLAFRLPWIKLSARDISATGRIALAACVLGFACIVASYLLALGSPRSIPISFAALFFMLSILGRTLAALVVTSLYEAAPGVPVAIFGAGSAGIQLAWALRQSAEVRPRVFVDDNPTLHGLNIAALTVTSRDRLRKMVDAGQVERGLSPCRRWRRRKFRACSMNWPISPARCRCCHPMST